MLKLKQSIQNTSQHDLQRHMDTIVVDQQVVVSNNLMQLNALMMILVLMMLMKLKLLVNNHRSLPPACQQGHKLNLEQTKIHRIQDESKGCHHKKSLR
jgi:hypothetical protein